MDIKKKEFNQAQLILSSIEVRREPGLFYEKDFIDYEDPSPYYSSAYELTEEQAKLTDIEAAEGMFKLMTIQFYGGDGNVLSEPVLFQNIREELAKNLSDPIDPNTKELYIEELIDIYNSVEKRIIEDENCDFKYDQIKLINIDGIENLDKKDKELYYSKLKFLKTELKHEISFLREQLTKIKNDTSLLKLSEVQANNTNQDSKIENTKIISNEVAVRALKWERDKSFKQDMLVLHKLICDANIIPKDTNLNDFSNAFSGKILNRTLRIKWLVSGKNKLTSKSSLFYFLSLLEDKHLIDNKGWRKNYGHQYRQISTIFVDKVGNPFSYESLKSSRSQGNNSKSCAMKNEIDQIVATVFELASNNLPG